MNSEDQFGVGHADEPGPSGAMGDAAPTPNLLQRVASAFVAPTRLGESLPHRAPWFWTLAIVAGVSAAVILLTPSDLLRQAAEAQIGDRPGATAPPVAMMRGLGAAGALLGSFAIAAVIAGVMYLVFNVILGQGESTYRQHLSVTAHAFWISLIGGLITFPLQISQGELQLKLGLGLALADEPSTYVEHLLNNITVFGIWAAAALGAMETGLSRGRISTGKGVGSVVGLYILWAAITAAFQNLMG